MLLNTDRLTLRDFTDDDWPEVLAYQSEPLYLRYNPWTTRRPDEVRQFVHRFVTQQHEDPRTKFQLAVVLKTTNQLIGNCGIRLEFTPMFDAAELHAANIGYELAPQHWGKGYATEAARAIVEFGFTQLRVHRISAWCIADNTGSAHVLEKLGMQLEGRMREKEYFKGRWWDTLGFAILEDEWRAQNQ
jgi:RimJ/RimL family protein N-acetyltransferase